MFLCTLMGKVRMVGKKQWKEAKTQLKNEVDDAFFKIKPSIISEDSK